MIATLAEVSLDSADPEGLMRFYQQVLGGDVVVLTTDFAVLRLTGVTLTSSRVADYQPPSWPEDTIPKQMHLDLRVENLEVAQV
ncbi:MAG: VOC family protein, partial [Dermatophilaceae bacterium]